MPTFYNFTENNIVRSFDDVFVPADAFRDGNLWIWGRGNYGSLGINNGVVFTQTQTPITTLSGGSNWKEVSIGYFFYVAAIKTDGTLWTWGNGSFFRLGTNDTDIARWTPVTTFAGGTNWKQVSCGNAHTAAVKTDGTLWTWGIGSYSSLGTNGGAAITPRTTFAGGTNWKQVSCGEYHTAAVKTDGTLWTWGRNSTIQLGTNDTINKSTPVTTFAGGTNWKQVSCGKDYTAAIKTDGTLWTWGNNAVVQLGDNTNTNKSTPVTTFSGGTNWKQVSCGNAHTAAVKTDGTLWTWGSGSYGKLGNNLAINISTPITTFAGGTNWKQVSFGLNDHASAIKTDGTLWVWGRGVYGRHGSNDQLDRSTPVTTFAGGTNWRKVSNNKYNVSAVTYIDSVI